ncbi:MAG: heat-inducible transcriptional repressor HrcA [Oscillospiraceae bacterium]|jgi:transcriptional regulator of heat shock response|nr:heat-inducible transcriptional repressor HrcA [Oscillospiraceae bacterium]
MDERKKAILRAVVDNYIQSAEPVGSRALAGQPGLDVSSATLRHEMAALEAMGFLEQPHTSAGRVPTPSGYRVYVDELMRKHDLTPDEQDTLNQVKKLRMAELDSLLNRAGRIIAELTRTVTVAAAGPAGRRPEVREEQVFVSGEANLLDYPEFQDLLRARRTLEYVTGQRAALIRQAPVWERDGVRVVIGPENAATELSDASVLMATYPMSGGMRGMIGVVGPTRMDYSRMVSRLGYFAEKLKEMTAEETE